jgi:nitrite reductase [NAD(P)H] small subunit
MTANRDWIRITECRNIPLREGRAVSVGGHDVAIFNLGDRFLAIQNRCPHKGGPLADGIVSGAMVVCPLHGWKVNLATGTVASPPAIGNCVKAFRARVESGWVFLDLRRDAGATSELRPAETDEHDLGALLRPGSCAPRACEPSTLAHESETAL